MVKTRNFNYLNFPFHQVTHFHLHDGRVTLKKLSQK